MLTFFFPNIVENIFEVDFLNQIGDVVERKVVGLCAVGELGDDFFLVRVQATDTLLFRRVVTVIFGVVEIDGGVRDTLLVFDVQYLTVSGEEVEQFALALALDAVQGNGQTSHLVVHLLQLFCFVSGKKRRHDVFVFVVNTSTGNNRAIKYSIAFLGVDFFLNPVSFLDIEFVRVLIVFIRPSGRCFGDGGGEAHFFLFFL